ncbi:MAG: T9SS type A sorting domain-containing protein, partial [Saprospiraceae bacterium]
PNVGSANIDALCNKEKALGYTNITTNYKDFPTYSWTAYAVTHEIGHNLGSPHTHSCLWSTGPIDNCWCPEGNCDQGAEPATTGGTVMSYCHLNPQWTNDCDLSASNPGINLASGFGVLPGELIRSRIANANCLGGSGSANFPFQANATVEDEACHQRNGAIDLTVSYGQTPYTYQWSNGLTTKDLTNLTAGVYGCTITDAKGAKTNVQVTVNGSEPFAMSAGADQIIGCAEPIVTLDGSDSPNSFSYNYLWTTIDGRLYGNVRKETIAVSESGTYVLTISNEDTGCVVSDTVTVREDFSEPTATLAAEALTCATTNTTINLVTNNNISTYQWTGPNGYSTTAANPFVNEVGVYKVTLTGTNGCSSEESIEVVENAENVELVAQGGVITCANSRIQLIASAGIIAEYSWTGPNNFTSTLQNPMVEQAGNYTVKAVTENGCTSETVVEVTAENTIPTIVAQNAIISCGEVNTQLSTTTSTTVTYNWTGPNNFQSNAQNPIVTDAGDYQLKVTAINGCTNETIVSVIADNIIPTVTAQNAIIDCESTNIQLNAVTSTEVTYNWTGPNNFQSNAQNPTVTDAGDYQLKVTAINGCTNETTVSVIADYAAPIITAQDAIITCGAINTKLSAKASTTVTYSWIGPNGFQSNAQDPTVTDAGTYHLEVTAINGCTSETNIVVSKENIVPTLVAKGGTLDCNHPTTTFVVNTADLDLAYNWTGPNDFKSTDKTPTVDMPGVYQLVAGKGAGCTTTIEVIVDANYTTPVVAIKGEAITCANPQVTLKALSNDNIQMYAWESTNGIFSNDQTIDVSEAGTYQLTVTNQNGCVTTEHFTVEAQTDLPIFELKANDLTCANPTSELKVVYSGTDLNFNWTGPENFTSNLANPTVTTPGIYEVAISNSNGCSTTASVIINQTASSTISFAATPAISCNHEIVMIDATASILTENVLVEWATEDGNIIHKVNDLMISVDQAGTYALTVRDLETECVTIQAIKVEGTPEIAARIDNDNVLNCAQTSLTLSANNGAYSENTVFNWVTDNGNIISDVAAREIEVDAAGFYTLMVTDTITGCTDATFTKVEEAARPAVNLSTPTMLTCNQPTTTISGGNSTLNATSTIEWTRNGEAIPNSNVLFLTVNTEGIYSMIIKDTLNQCIATSEIVITTHEAPQATVAALEEDACHKGEGMIALVVNTTSTYEIEWNTGAKGAKIENLSAGEYTATITDGIGCQVVISQNIQNVAPISLVDANINPATCDGSENGHIEVALQGGNFPYETQWSNGETALIVDGLATGTHILEVIDAKGCVTTFDFEMRAPNALEAELTVLHNDVKVAIMGGTPDYEFSWSDGTTEQYGSNFAPGTHEVTIQDANGCSITKSFEVDATTALTEVVPQGIEIAVFPNPTTEYFKVKRALQGRGSIKISVYSAGGIEMMSTTKEVSAVDETINTANWVPGSYFLHVATKEGIAVKKIEVIRL